MRDKTKQPSGMFTKMLSEKLDTEVKNVEFKNKETSISNSKSFSIALSKSKELSNNIDDKTCRICMEMKLDSVFFPCGHPTGCFLCSIKVIVTSGVCPFCRSMIQEIYRYEEETIPDLCKVIECVDFVNIIHYTKLLQAIC